MKLIAQYQEGRENSSAPSPLMSPALNTQYPDVHPVVSDVYWMKSFGRDHDDIGDRVQVGAAEEDHSRTGVVH